MEKDNLNSNNSFKDIDTKLKKEFNINDKLYDNYDDYKNINNKNKTIVKKEKQIILDEDKIKINKDNN